MPFTPLHFGPGALFKSIAPREFSLSVFIFSQVLIDLEPLYFIIRDDWPLHRFLHTWPGAGLVALASIMIGRPLCEQALALLRWRIRRRHPSFAVDPIRISLRSASIAAVIGAASHVALDSIMHADMQPLAPFSHANHLLDLVTIQTLHLLCIGAGLLGLAVLGLRQRFQARRRRDG
ncbi:MAG: DUF4184 family protein [Gammaproteobacteria bacterium]|nr:DUF4184 family protein [Gammaproteobacteria bacterium]